MITLSCYQDNMLSHFFPENFTDCSTTVSGYESELFFRIRIQSKLSDSDPVKTFGFRSTTLQKPEAYHVQIWPRQRI
jgi:hypothetical protein